MTLQDLRYLVTLADEGHFGRSAELCCVSQPTLSTQLKKLEEELGLQLFERAHKRVLPTPLGRVIVAQARVVLDEAAKLQVLARQGSTPMAGILRLGLIHTLAPYYLPHLLPQVHASYPHLRLYLREELTAHLLHQLRTGALDALLLALPVLEDGLEVVPLFHEPFVLALPPGHALARHAEVQEGALANERVLLLDDGHCLRDQTLAVCGFPVRGETDEFRASSLETLRHMVATGLGCTLLPALAAAMPSPSVSLLALRPFAAPAPGRTIGLVWRRSFPRGVTLRHLATLIQQQLPPGVLPALQGHTATADTSASSAGQAGRSLHE
ncbi:MAG: LysR substrate-binding domain-containing protein [Candidatus Tectimicrobiota bacterium]